jgi:hypothetical protein
MVSIFVSKERKMDLITVECINDFDPKLVRVTVHTPVQDYSFDIVASDYAAVATTLGWPASPCDS